MAFEESAQHKSGPLKQQNKTHKHGRHRSKSEIDKTNKGRALNGLPFLTLCGLYSDVLQALKPDDSLSS